MIALSSSPLADIEGGPVLFPVQGATFQLEPLEAEDAERIEAANAIVLDWLGHEFGISWLSFWNDVERFRPVDLEYASQYASSLDAPVGVDEDETILLQNFGKLSRDAFQVTVTGSNTPGAGSPLSYEFWAEIPEVGLGERYRAHAALSLTVPLERPIAEFYERVTEIAKCLRLRWGAAGHTYASWILYDYEVAAERLYAHARRFPGFDVGEYVGLCERWHDEIRSVNWLTWLGPAFADRLTALGKNLVSTPELDIRRSGDAVLIQAGRAPESGDRNRLQVPRAYVAADELVRPLRARDGVDFGAPWTDITAGEWLRRFELAWP